MARSMLDALLKQPRRMGARTASRNTLGINHPLAESSPVSRIPISMMPGGGPASGYTQEDLATLALPKETTLFSPLGYDITDKDLAKFGLATDALDLVPGAAVLGGLATGAGLLGRAVKGNRVAPESDEMMSAILGPAMQRQGLLDDAMVGVDPSPFYSGEKLTKEQRALRRAELRAEANALRFGDDDYRIQHSSPAPEGKNSIDDPSDIYDHNIYGAKGAQYYGTGDPAMDKATIKILNEVKQNPDSLVTIYRAVPSDVDDAINAGDWITINKDYAKNHGESALNGDYKIIEQQARAGDIFTNGDSLHEQGWHPGNRDPAIAATPEPSVDEFIGGLLDDNAIEPMWSPKALKDAANQNHKSRNILIGMAPQEFLRMTDDLSKPDLFKKTRIADAREAGNQMDSVPMLGFDNMGEGRAKVVAHEGRHRALRAIEEGHDIIPVLLNSQEGGNAAAIRWGSQEPGTRDYVDDFPTILEAQGKKTDALPFPVQRNQTAPSVDEFVGKLLDDELPMDEASRMQRARDMGFDTDTTLYHGSKQDIDEFKPKYEDGLTFLTKDPEFAGKWIKGTGGLRDRVGGNSGRPFAEAEEQALRESVDLDEYLTSMEAWGNRDEVGGKLYADMLAERSKLLEQIDTVDSAIYPVHTSATNTFDPRKDYAKIEDFLRKRGNGMDELIKQGKHKEGNWVIYENKEVVEELKRMGYDSMAIKESSFDGAPHDTVAVFDPKNIRSKHAKFDPAKRNSSNILASAAPIVATGLLGANALRGLYEPDALKDDEAMRRALLRN